MQVALQNANLNDIISLLFVKMKQFHSSKGNIR